MFVLKSTHDKVIKAAAQVTGNYMALKKAHDLLLSQWNWLVDKVNAKGGEVFLENAVMPTPPFTEDEINFLIRVSHPDRNKGSDVSNEVTKKLLAMRK